MTDWHTEETYKSLIAISTSALRFVLYANGGAAVAILAFIGSVWGRPGTVPNVETPLALFLVGVFVGGLAHVTAYLTQLALYNEQEGTQRQFFKRHNTWLYISIAFVLLGVAAFGAGALVSVGALSR